MQARIGVLLSASSISTFVFFSSNHISLSSNIGATLIQLLAVDSMIIHNCIFNDNNQTFLSTSTSNVIISNSLIQNIFCNDLVFACLALVLRGQLKIVNSTILNITSLMNKPIISAIQSQFIFRDNYFANLMAMESPVVFYFDDSFLFIHRNNFFKYERGLIHIIQSTLMIDETIFVNFMETNDNLASAETILSTVKIDNTTSLIFNSNFTGNLNNMKDGGVNKINFII